MRLELPPEPGAPTEPLPLPGGQAWLVYNRAVPAQWLRVIMPVVLVAVALFFGLTVAANDFIYGIKPFGLIPIDFGYILLWFGIAGCMVGGLQRRARP